MIIKSLGGGSLAKYEWLLLSDAGAPAASPYLYMDLSTSPDHSLSDQFPAPPSPISLSNHEHKPTQLTISLHSRTGDPRVFFSRPLPKAGRELQTELNTRIMNN